MSISCVIIACSKSQYHRSITERAIESSGVDCIVVETCNKRAYEKATQTLFWNKEFNYNACLNYGIEYTNTEYIALCNNDLIFDPGWTRIENIMKENNILSASPFSLYSTHRHGYKVCDKMYKGYWIGHELLGWCIVVHKSIFEKIGKLDETYKFWCSDNAYADQIESKGIEHYLICNCIVNHIGGGSKTIKTVNQQLGYNLTTKEYLRYAKVKGHERSVYDS
jgi:hypothetical protein